MRRDLVDVEPWLRGTLTEIEPVKRAVLHALELAGEDVAKWGEGLGDGEMFARPCGLAPAAFQLRHIARSLDRILTYAEGRALGEAQLAALQLEMSMEGTAAEVRREFEEGLRRSMERVRLIAAEDFAVERGVGRKALPTTVGGLLVHCADHTQRHVGQFVTTVKVVRSFAGQD
jgi:hypothetical protein